MKKMIKYGLGAAIVVGLGAVWMFWPTPGLVGWKPTKPVEFVIMAGKGGGADKMARLMQAIIKKNGWTSKPLVPINKPGRSGAEALIHLKDKASSDPNHTIMVTLNSFYTTPLRRPELKIDIAKFTPIARMAEDTFLLWVHKDSGIVTVDDFIKAARAAGRNWLMAGTGKLQEDQLLTDYLNAAYGLNMKYVPYRGGGKVAKQLATKNANSTVNNPSEQDRFHKTGITVPLAAFTPKRLAMFPNTPTFGEIGKDFSYFMQRSVVGAPGMSKEAADFYQKLFKKVFASAEWQAYRRKKSLQGEFLTGKPLVDYWVAQRDFHAAMLKSIGALN